MKAPTRLLERKTEPGSPEAESARLVDAARSTIDWSAQERGAVWRRIAADAARPRRKWWLGLTVLAPALAAVIVIARWPHAVENPAREWVPLEVAGASLEISANGAAHADGAGQIVVERGRLRGKSGPLVVVTPKLRLRVSGARFQVEVLEQTTTVTLDEGAGEAIAPSGTTRALHTGESLRSDDPRLAAPVVVVAPAPPVPLATVEKPRQEPPARRENDPIDPCRTRGAARRDCYLGLADGDDLAAQNALYELGLLERDERHDPAAAIARWRSWQQRFGDGALAAEVSFGILDALVADGKPAEAAREAEHYLATFPGDGRAAEVALLRARLLRESLHDLPGALAAYQSVGETGRITPGQREEALFLVGVCQSELGHADQARETWKKCRARFGSGVHAAEIDRLLGR
jgi:TolA-binding protein